MRRTIDISSTNQIKVKKPIRLTVKPSLFYKFNKHQQCSIGKRSSKELLQRFKLSERNVSIEKNEKGDYVVRKSISPTQSLNADK